MAVIWRTRRFDKSFQSLGPQQQVRAAKSLELFREDPRHPSLHLEKLSGSDYRTIRVDLNHRIVLIDSGDDVYDLLDIGTHDYVYRRFG